MENGHRLHLINSIRPGRFIGIVATIRCGDLFSGEDALSGKNGVRLAEFEKGCLKLIK